MLSVSAAQGIEKTGRRDVRVTTGLITNNHHLPPDISLSVRMKYINLIKYLIINDKYEK